MLMEEPVHYIHRTVRVVASPLSRDQSTMASSAADAPAKKEKRKKKLTSIMPETALDVIAELSEHSETSTSQTSMNESVIQSPARKNSSPVRVSPKRKVKLPKVPATICEDDDDEQVEVVSSPSKPRAVRKLKPPPSMYFRQSDAIQEVSENDLTGETDKLTQSDSEGAEKEESTDEESDIDDLVEVRSKPTSLSNFLQSPAVPQITELPSFDADNSVMMFDYDGDENDEGDFTSSKHSVSQHEEDDELTWRLDPSESLSDWTITVVSKGAKSVQDYHVHKNMLAVGKRKSEYFARIFRQHRQEGNRSAVSELILPDTAASMIPILLDYIYTSEAALTLSSETAPGLRYLAQFFGIKALFERIMRFIQKDLSLNTLVPYYQGSRDLDDKKVLGIAARHCARNIHLIDVSHNLIEVIDPTFFCKVFSSPGLDGVEKKLHLSLLVAKYCQLHKDKLDGPSFLSLTSETNLPEIHHLASLSLLGMEADIVVATSFLSMMSMTSLQERCIKGLASHWRELTVLDPARTAQVCRKLPSLVVTELMIRSLENAKKSDTSPTPTRVILKRDGSPKSKPKDEAKMKKEYEEALEKLRAEFALKTKHLQELCYEKDKHIKGYYEELCRFQRLPNSLDGKLSASGRSAQPTMMPPDGKHSEDGYIFAGKKKGSPKYPVFYYKGEERS